MKINREAKPVIYEYIVRLTEDEAAEIWTYLDKSLPLSAYGSTMYQSVVALKFALGTTIKETIRP